MMPKPHFCLPQTLQAFLWATLSLGLPGLKAQGVALQQGFFPDHSRIVWLGDSITHQGLFSRFIEDFLYSRYPKRSLLFVNCGVNGDRSGDALGRFDLDVAPWKPTKVFVCLGMNDGGFSRKGLKAIPEFQRNIQGILLSIKKLGAQAFLLSPPPVDPHVFLQFGTPPPRQGPLEGYNLVLERFTSLLKKEAKRSKVPFVNLHAPLLGYNRRLKFQNPGASLITDGIHPGHVGSALIAMTILKALGEQKGRLHLRISGSKIDAKNAQVKNMMRSGGELLFDVLTNSLPWVLPEAARGAAVLEQGYGDFNRFIVEVKDLPSGTFELSIDGKPLGRFSAEEFAKGVDLSLATEHPDWIQAEQCVAWNAQRGGLVRTGIRDIWEARRVLAKLRTQGSAKTLGFLATQKRLRALEENVGRVGTKLRDLERKIQAGIQPRWHSYSIRSLPLTKDQ